MILSTKRSFELGSIDNDLFITILDLTVLKPNALHCFKCKPYDHLTQECPFPSEKKMAMNENQKQPQPSQMKYTQNDQDGSNRWQRGKGYFEQCK